MSFTVWINGQQVNVSGYGLLQNSGALKAPELQCPSRYRLLTAQEAGNDDSALIQYGGRYFTSDEVRPHTYGWVLTLKGATAVIYVPTNWVAEEVTHDFVDTGSRRSWCRRCNGNAIWNGTTAKFETE